MQIDYVRVLLEGLEVCIASRAMVSSYVVVADRLNFVGSGGQEFFARLKGGEKFPVIAYFADGTEKVAGEAFMYEQTPDRMHIGIWRKYGFNACSGRWET
jgi:hypothetical protein